MSREIKRIKRDIYIIKYRKTPLIEYEKESDSEVFYFPKSKFNYWIKLEKDNPKKMIFEILKLLKLLEFDRLIFLDAKNKSWISKETNNRKDYNPLTKTIQYFKSLKINTKFNGGIEIEYSGLRKFLPHFYRLTCCDRGFFDYYFSDKTQNILFHLHYSGELQLLIQNDKMNKKFINIIKKTDFVDAFILEETTNRI